MHDARLALGDKVQHVLRRAVDARQVVKVFALLTRDRASLAFGHAVDTAVEPVAPDYLDVLVPRTRSAELELRRDLRRRVFGRAGVEGLEAK